MSKPKVCTYSAVELKGCLDTCITFNYKPSYVVSLLIKCQQFDLVFSICRKHDSKSEMYFSGRSNTIKKNKQLLTDSHVLNSAIFPIIIYAADNTHVMSRYKISQCPQCPVDSFSLQHFFRFLFRLQLLDIVIPVKTWTWVTIPRKWG